LLMVVGGEPPGTPRRGPGVLRSLGPVGPTLVVNDWLLWVSCPFSMMRWVPGPPRGESYFEEGLLGTTRPLPVRETEGACCIPREFAGGNIISCAWLLAWLAFLNLLFGPLLCESGLEWLARMLWLTALEVAYCRVCCFPGCSLMGLNGKDPSLSFFNIIIAGS
jgi:hypothetical protein